MRESADAYSPSPLYDWPGIRAVRVLCGFAEIAMFLEMCHCLGQEIGDATKSGLRWVLNCKLDTVLQFAIECFWRHHYIIARQGSLHQTLGTRRLSPCNVN